MSDDNGKTVVIRREGPVVRVILNRPDKYNAFDLAMAKEFGSHMQALAEDESVRGIVITGEGKAFCAGGDLSWAVGHAKGQSAALSQLAGRFHQAILEIRRMAKPVIAAINGVAAGGGFSLALGCDFRVMATSATLIQGFTSRGLTIDSGGTFALTRLVGLARAMEVAAFDRPIPSDQAWAWGLATKVVEDGKVVDAAVDMAQELSRNSLHAYGWTKQLLMDSLNTPLEAHLERERAGIAACAAHPDGIEGLAAFLEKRKPQFS